MYTSGTTGDPKGVLISNNSIVTLIAGVHRLLGSVDASLDSNDVYLSFLPLAHIFDWVIEECFINHGASIGFWRGDVKLLIEDIGEPKPTILCAVPRVLDRIYSGLQLKISSGGFLKSKLVSLAYAYKLHSMKGRKKHPHASPLSDKIVFSKIKQGLGGAGHLGSVISSMGRWRMRLEVPRAEIDEMLLLARLVSRSDVVPHYLNVDLALGDIRVAKCIKSHYPCVPLEEA
ncbi:long chain acyl-CoA synthetase 4 [Lactuca sativa]|uniref:long chain acyl-CoA synthetase 4 n=1 Tax=Lactuca sativa TaxID=4236 RepID=UPI0022AF340C|nr:long chain acyl-CoA synthetase 4 [Lactuca sativa]